MRRLFHIVLLALVIGLAAPVQAKVEVLVFGSPAKEALYKELIQELRCLVCQNQNLADSNAELAGDLRTETHEMVEAGKSRDEIVDYMVARYGDFVLYRPPVNTTTAMLWGGPFLLVLIGLISLFVYIRRNNADKGVDTLTDTDRARAESLLADTDSGKSSGTPSNVKD